MVFYGVLIGAVGLLGEDLAGILFIPMYVAWIWIGLANSAKRWHDRNKSGWWSLVAFVPIIGPIWALVEQGFLPGDSGPNRFGERP